MTIKSLLVEKCWSKRIFLFAVNKALYSKEITVQKQKLIILEIRQTKSLTDGLPDNKTDGLPDNKTVDKTLAAIEFRV